MKCVLKEDGKIVNHQPGILKEISKFYQNLYTADEKVTFALDQHQGESLVRNAKGMV